MEAGLIGWVLLHVMFVMVLIAVVAAAIYIAWYEKKESE